MIGWILLAGFAAILVLSVGLRPWYIFYGLSEEECNRHWPGDDLIPGAKPSGSRGITIEIPAAQVWPWITQIGQDRAGFYSYRWLENMVGAQMPDVRHLVPKWSHRKKGDLLFMAPPSRFGKVAEMPLAKVVEYQHLVYFNAEGTWAFILVPVASNRCRLIARGTWLAPRNVFLRAAHATVFDPIHFLMEWKMLRTIKALAEAAVV